MSAVSGGYFLPYTLFIYLTVVFIFLKGKIKLFEGSVTLITISDS